MNMGWTCPTCGVNWAPTVERCDCQGTQAIGVPLKPIPQPPLTTKYFGMGPITTTVDLGTTTMDTPAWQERKATG